jgi:uncharacterized membrane protein
MSPDNISPEIEEYFKEKYKHRYVIGTKEMMLKTFILRIISSIISCLLVYYFTRSWYTSANILWIDFILKTFLYYGYEYEWFKLRKHWANEEE